MGGKIRELTGQRFGRLTAIRRAPTDRGKSRWECVCDCGKTKTARAECLTRGETKSCGCFAREVTRATNTKHGHRRFVGYYQPVKSREYATWASMIRRCENPKGREYVFYGARGISVCSRWRKGENGKTGFECFLEDMGRHPGKGFSIDRYPDNNGNYQPGNCRWATAKEQANNRRPRGPWSPQHRANYEQALTARRQRQADHLACEPNGDRR